MKKTHFIKDLKDGQIIDEIFLVGDKSLRDFKDKPDKYLQVDLKDSSGSLPGKKWDEGQVYFEKFNTGNLVKIKGRVTAYQGNLQIIIDSLTRVESDQINWPDFVAASPRDIKKMWTELKEFISQVTAQPLVQLLNIFFGDAVFVSRFQTAPAGKSWHQAYLGGLLEHTLNVVKICEFVLGLYPEASRDLLLTGAILHDIGKIYEYSFPQIIDYTDEGRLLGHISIQDALVTEKIREIKNFPAELKNLLRHMLLSHHGEKEMGSPKRPKTLEAIILHFADNLDAQSAGFTEIIKKTRGRGQSWSEYIKLIDRFLYAGRDTVIESEESEKQ